MYNEISIRNRWIKLIRVPLIRIARHSTANDFYEKMKNSKRNPFLPLISINVLTSILLK